MLLCIDMIVNLKVSHGIEWVLDFLFELGHNNAKISCNAEKRGLIWILG